MEGYGHVQGYDYNQFNKRGLMPSQLDHEYDHHIPSGHARLGASSSGRPRDLQQDGPGLPSTIRNLEPSLRDKGLLVWKLVSRAASRLRRPGGQRPPGSFGEYFCECGKDYMNSCGLNNHWKLSHKLPGRPPQLFVPSAVQMKLLHGMELTAQDLQTVLVQPSVGTRGLHPPNAIRFEDTSPEENVMPNWPPQVPVQPPSLEWSNPIMSGRKGLYGEPQLPQHFGARDQHMHMPGMLGGLMNMPSHVRGAPYPGETYHQLPPPMIPNGFHVPPPLHSHPDIDGEYTRWTMHAKEFESSIKSWATEAGFVAQPKVLTDSDYELDHKSKLEVMLNLQKMLLDDEIVKALIEALAESDHMMIPYAMRPDSSIWERLFFQTRGKQIGATHAVGLFLVTIRPEVSAKFFTEVAFAMAVLLGCYASNSQTLPVPDSPAGLIPVLDIYGRDFFPQFLLHPTAVKSSSCLQLLGLAPAAHQRLLSTLRLLAQFLELVGFTDTILDWNPKME